MDLAAAKRRARELLPITTPSRQPVGFIELGRREGTGQVFLEQLAAMTPGGFPYPGLILFAGKIGTDTLPALGRGFRLAYCGCMRRVAKAAIGLELLLGIGALGGGIALMAGPNGEVLPLPVSALAGSPFTSYFVPGAILCFVLGVGPLCAAALAWRQHRVAPFLTFAVGCALVIWIAVEIAIVGYSNHPPLQLIYLVLGGAITLVGVDWLRTVGRR